MNNANNLHGFDIMSWVFRGGLDTIVGWLNPERDGWTLMDDSERFNFINTVCIAGAKAVLAGEIYSLDEVFTEVIPEVGQTYNGWKQHANNHSYVYMINITKEEIQAARSIINDSNSTTAQIRLQNANFSYVSKTQVNSILTGSGYDPLTDATTTETSINTSSMLAPLITWAQENPLLAGALGLALVAGVFIAFNSSNKQPSLNSAPKGKIAGVKSKQLS